MSTAAAKLENTTRVCSECRALLPARARKCGSCGGAAISAEEMAAQNSAREEEQANEFLFEDIDVAELEAENVADSSMWSTYYATRSFVTHLGQPPQMMRFSAGQVIVPSMLLELLRQGAPIAPEHELGSFHTCPKCSGGFSW